MDIRSFQLENCKTLPSFIENSIRLYAEKEALRQFDRANNAWHSLTYKELGDLILSWRKAFAAMRLAVGTRIAILMPNGIDHVCADQAALANGLVPVPLHAIDTPGACAFVINDSKAEILITNKRLRWNQIKDTHQVLPTLKQVLILDRNEHTIDSDNSFPTIKLINDWLDNGENLNDKLPPSPNETDLACIVYTSGTMGRPKGVMLTHKNIVSNVLATLHCVSPKVGDIFLSFLPLSHTFERTAGYYLALATGCVIAYNRSILLLGEDLKVIHPDVIISVPRIYERIFSRINTKLNKGNSFTRYLFFWAVEIGWRDFCRKNQLPVEKSKRAWLDNLMRPLLLKKISRSLLDQFGGKLRIAISGGAAINSRVVKAFCGLGLPIIQGYGMTEASPIIAGNNLDFNQPDTVGRPFVNVQVRLGEHDEIQIKGPSVMLGYWNRPEATKNAFTDDGWLKTGDIGELSAQGTLRIKGRIKEIIVTSTGEKIPPADLEGAIETDELFSQCFIVGENKPFIGLIAVVNPEYWKTFALHCGVNPDDPKSLNHPNVRNAALKRVKQASADFPHYAIPRAIWLTQEPWTIENGLLTPTLKLKRKPLSDHLSQEIGKLYINHT